MAARGSRRQKPNCTIALLFWLTRAIHVWTAVITAKETNMESTITNETGTAEAAVAAEEPKPNKPKPAKKAAVAKKGAHVAPKKAKATKKAALARKAPKGQKKAKPAAREGSKISKVLDLLKRPDGATLKELMKVTGWLKHSIRGCLSGLIGKKMGLAVISTKGEDGERSYFVKS